MNRVFFVGILPADPETRHIPASGSVVCNFGLAVNEKWNDPRPANSVKPYVCRNRGVGTASGARSASISKKAAQSWSRGA